MKQEFSAAADSRISRRMDSQRLESARFSLPGSKPVLKNVSTESNRTTKLVLECGVSNSEVKAQNSKHASRALDQYTKFRRRLDGGYKTVGDEKKDVKVKELQRKPSSSEKQSKDLEKMVEYLKEGLEKLQSCNSELELQNKSLQNKLAAAEAKIMALERRNQAFTESHSTQPSEFDDARNSIANKLVASNMHKEAARRFDSTRFNISEIQTRTAVANIQPKEFPVRLSPSPRLTPPPPPPRPPPNAAHGRSTSMQKGSALADLYNIINKKDSKNVPLAYGTMDAHNSIVGEIRNRSAHLLTIKADVETKEDLIRSLIERVNSAVYTDIEDVLTFVDWLDQELSTLADERAVLKHFNWPEKKADALREAAFEYRALKRLAHEAFSFEDDLYLPCEAALKKISSLLEKSEQSIQRLTRLRDTMIMSYKECKIPTGWILDTGMVMKMKMASVKLAKVYLKRISVELNSLWQSERGPAQESLLAQGIRFACRVHQFAGGLDSEAMCALEDFKKRVHSHARG